LIEVVVVALWAEKALGAAGVADQFRLATDGSRRGEALVAYVVGGVDGLLIELGQQNVGDGPQNRLWRALQQIGQAGGNLPFAQANGSIQRSKAAETNRDKRNRRPGA